MGRRVQASRGGGVRVTHVIVGLDIGGAELMLKRLIDSHHANADFQHRVISLTSLGIVGKQLLAKGVEVQVMNMHSLLYFPATLFRLSWILRSQRPDLVQTWMYHADLLGGLAARLAGIKHVIWGIRTTDVTAGGSRNTSIVRWLCARLSSWIPHTIVCAAEASRRVHVDLGYCESRMTVVPNGFELQHLKATIEQVERLRSKCSFSTDTVVIGTIGRFSPVKDQHNFVFAAGLLAREHHKVRFLMIGRDCVTTNAELMGWITSTGYAERFVLLGERSDVPVCLATMDIFCLPSRTEGFPNVVGEAMGMRKACVVTDVGDAAYLLGTCGVIVPKDDSAALAVGLNKLVSLSDAERAELGERSRVRIETEFTMDSTREKFEAVYAQVLTGEAPK